MIKVKIKSVNSVVFGKSSEKQTPYIKLLCTDENGEYCQYTGWKTTNNLENLKIMLAKFGLEHPLTDIIELDDSRERATFFKAPKDEVLIEETEYNGKVYRNITGMQKEPIADSINKEESKSIWQDLTFQAVDITQENQTTKDPF